jgi:heat shock protein HslJ
MKFKVYLLVLLSLCFPISSAAQTGALQGTWSFLSITENTEDIALPAPDEYQPFRFAKGGRFTSSVGCNHISGKYVLGVRGKIKFNSIITTAKACFRDEQKAEQSLTRVLKKISRYQIKDNVLTLQDERGENVIALTKE